MRFESMQFTRRECRTPTIRSVMKPTTQPITLPCVLMRAGTSRGPFFLRDWLPRRRRLARDQALIGAIGASDPLQTRRRRRRQHADQQGGHRLAQSNAAGLRRRTTCSRRSASASAPSTPGPTAATCSSGVAPFAIEQGWCRCSRRHDHRARVQRQHPLAHRRDGADARWPRVLLRRQTPALTAWPAPPLPIQLDFLDAWGAVTGSVFPTGQRIDVIDGVRRDLHRRSHAAR